MRTLKSALGGALGPADAECSDLEMPNSPKPAQAEGKQQESMNHGVQV